MANKEVLDQINAERIRRSRSLDCEGPAIQVALEYLAESWGREADLLSRSQKKAWQSERKTLLEASALLRLEIIAVGRLAAAKPPVRQPVTGPTPSWTNPEALDALVKNSEESGKGKLIAGDKRCPAQGTAHDKHTWTGPRDETTGSDRWQCWGGDEDGKTVIGASDVEAYLSGATDDLISTTIGPSGENGVWLPGDRVTMANMNRLVAQLHTAQDGTVAVLERLGTHLATESAVHQQIDRELPDVHAEPLVPLFTEAEAPARYTRPVPPMGAALKPYTWAELSTPASSENIPDHLSPSQLSTLDTCPAQARISRYDGSPGVPLWGAIGGTAFHRCVEEIERNELANGDKPNTDALWNKHFHTRIAEVIAETGMPMEDWYASNRGKENYSWWLVEGGEMLKRYFQWRFYGEGNDGRTVFTLPDGRPAIELELMLNLDNGIPPVKVILDLVFQTPDGTLEIVDLKTKGWGMDVDTIQLGTQGRALAFELDNGPMVQTGITARYFDARKGELSEPFDPLERHPIEELEMRYADADDQRRNRPAIPKRSNLCKACPVAYLCPVGSKL